MSFKAEFGPWIGVPVKKQRLCAVKDCISPGKEHVCPWDGRLHHHGCVHYNCEAAKAAVARTGLEFREGWGLICDTHYDAIAKG